MLYFFRLLLLLINIDQETVLNWFGIENSINQDFNQSNFETSTDVSLTTFPLILESLWKKVQDGLTLGDIEYILFFILFIRFVILAIRYNLKTSLYITCIGLFAGLLWYRHLTDMLFMYRMLLVKLPFVHKLGPDYVPKFYAMHMNQRMEVIGDPTSSLPLPSPTTNRIVRHTATFQPPLPVTVEEMKFKPNLNLRDLKSLEDIHWYNPAKLLYSAIKKAIVVEDDGKKYYIDPISMIISKLPESIKLKILPIHYTIYNEIIPTIFSTCSKYWKQISSMATYAFITRIGKLYCPYLVRWHWTFLVILGLVEPPLLYFTFRCYYFLGFILMPRSKVNPDIVYQVSFLKGFLTFLVLTHIAFALFGLFHAIWGQYFYFPFLVANVELHTGPRPTDSVYSGGQTSWQNKDEKDFNRSYPKVWYGWFGRGTKNELQFTTNIRKFLKKMIKKLRRQF